jgi:hypothetical protein
VSPGERVFLYTGAGETRKTTVANSTIPAYVFHWGRGSTLFTDSRVVPLLFKFGGLNPGFPPVDVPQLPLIK